LNINLITKFIRELYKSNDFIPLHAPTFGGNEKKYVLETIDSTFVSSVGKFVDQFEKEIELFTGSNKAIATSNGTAALHAALHVSGVQKGDLVITQALTFVATGNVIHHMGASPIFLDVSKKSLGLCPLAVSKFLHKFAAIDQDGAFHKKTGQRIKAIVPMHTFGHPVELDELIAICEEWKLTLIEDAAESLGSLYKGRHTGTLGDFGALSFNGNKIITTGGGGAILTKSKYLATRALKLTTTSKVSHKWEYIHDELGYNYRMPNLNSALGLAQLEKINIFLRLKKKLFKKYSFILKNIDDVKLVSQPKFSKSNFWLQTIVIKKNSKKIRDRFLLKMHKNRIFARPVWNLLHKQKHLKNYPKMNLSTAESLKYRIINLPSSPYLGK